MIMFLRVRVDVAAFHIQPLLVSLFDQLFFTIPSFPKSNVEVRML
jgi:hypothetical protein